MAIERLQKFLSNAGIASRRRAEQLIQRGLVTINGKTAKLGDKVNTDSDRVLFNGKVIKPEQQLFYIAVNKPKGYISSRFDPKGRKSVYDLAPKELRDKVWTVGRLDFYTEGLIIFTNDGELTQQLAHPKFEHEKEYEVEVSKDFTEAQLDKLRRGVAIGEGRGSVSGGSGRGSVTAPAKIRVRDKKIIMSIHEGKKRQVRRMFEAVGLKVKNLKRTRENKLMLGDLPLGKYKFVTREDII